MFKNVIVGVDENGAGRDAIALARRLMAHGGALTLAHVYWGDPGMMHGSGATYDAAEREGARRLLEGAREEAGIDAGLRSRGSSSIGRGLHELAEMAGADLLVIGAPGSGVLGRIHVAESVHEALSGASCAVAFAPAGYGAAETALRRIGVGYDGSPESEHALAVARNLAAQTGATLSACEVVNFPTWLRRGRTAVDGTQIGDALAGARARIAALGGVEPLAAYGPPAEELALLSASLDLLVVGSRGYGPIGRLIHGAVSEQLVRSAHCPLLVLPRIARKARAAGRSTSERGAVPATAG